MNETTTGAPLTATVGERVGDDPRVKAVQQELAQAPAERRRPARSGGRPFPWATVALVAVAWVLTAAIGRRLRAGARRAARGARALVRA